MESDNNPGAADDPFSEQLIDVMLVACGLDWKLNRAVPIEEGADTVYRLDVRDDRGIDRRAILKAPRETTERRFGHEPKLLQYVAGNTSIPVPTVHAIYLDPVDLPAPYYVMEDSGVPTAGRASLARSRKAGSDRTNVSGRDVLARVATDAGRHLGAFHDCGPVSGFGSVGIDAGELRILARDADSWAEWLRSTVESSRIPWERLGSLEADLRQFARDAIEDVPDVEPVPIHYDYRPQNLVIDERGNVNAVLDWGAVRSAHGSYELVLTEQYLCKWAPLDAETRAIIRGNLYDAYADQRSIDRESTLRHRKLYLAVSRITAFARFHDLPETERAGRLSRHEAFFRALL